MSITEWSEGVLLVDLSPEPSISEDLQQLQRTIDGPGVEPKHVVLNFQEVNGLTSSNIAALLRIRKRVLQLKRRLFVCAVSDKVWTIFMTAGLDDVFETSSEVSTALASVQMGIE
ncbi:MAG: STAS domain-containing protein [Planctomycetes bacterium]|nr:STAS domain-containing protein [Planctomycetota bacterium]